MIKLKQKHYNKVWEILLIIIVLEILFVICSINNKIINNLSILGLKLRFYSFSELIDFNVNKENILADSLIKKYEQKHFIKRRILLSNLNYKQNNFFDNPLNRNNQFALDLFFEAVLSQRDSCVVRIAHYGDSQLEGDRITHVLRKKIQNYFGGTGVGFIPFVDIAEPVTYYRNSSDNWCKYNVFDNKYYSEFYGMGGIIFKFNHCKKYQKTRDTIINKLDSNVYLKSNYASIYINLRPSYVYKKLVLMYGKCLEYCIVKVSDKNYTNVYYDTLIPTNGFNLHKLNLLSSFNPLRLEFYSDISPDFYGLLLDGNNGVQVDNFAIRGHSGIGLMNIAQEYLATQIKLLNTKLIIFQYGGNVVPYINDSIDYQKVEQFYYALFNKFKKAAPQTSILVVSTGDMARKIGDKYISYPQIPYIVDAQHRAALKAGCAFWNLYAAMGGQGSIKIWSEKKLASPDGHFSNKGQEIIGNELFNAIISEYNNYCIRKLKSK